MILGADIGGTNARFAIFRDGSLRPLKLRVYPSSEFKGVVPLVKRYLDECGCVPEVASLSLAGPVRGSAVYLTNLGWRVDASRLKKAFGFREVFLVNDLEATSYGIAGLSSTHTELLYKGKPPYGRVFAVVAPGTGLGESVFLKLKERLVVLPSEGGHVEIPVDSEEEWRIYERVKEVFGHASVERVVSGPGLSFLFEYFSGRSASPEEVVRLASQGDSVAERAVVTLVKFLAREAGNLALKVLPFGGLFLAGGLSVPLLPWLKRYFLEEFLNKGRLREVLERIPIRVVKYRFCALVGAAAFARSPSPLRY